MSVTIFICQNQLKKIGFNMYLYFVLLIEFHLAGELIE